MLKSTDRSTVHEPTTGIFWQRRVVEEHEPEYSVIVIEVADRSTAIVVVKRRVRYVSIEEEERRPEKDPDTVRQRRVIEVRRPEYGSVVCRRRRVQYVSIEESADQRRIGIRSTAASSCR
jgi:hypothetical protein